MMTRRIWQLSFLAMMTGAAFGCGSGSGTDADIANGANAPILDDLRILTNPVYLGVVVSGEVYAEDTDGLAGLTLRLDFAGPATGSFETRVSTADTAITADVPFDFTLEPGWPTGEYTITLTAIDTQGFESDPASTTVFVQVDASGLTTDDP